MKQKKSAGLEPTNKSSISLKKIILIALGILLFIGLLAFIVNPQKDSGTDDGLMPITEAQAKCKLMELSDRVNYMGEPNNENTARDAEKHCLSLWDTPEKQEEFRRYIKNDWETEKTITIEGLTLEQIYDNSK